MVKVVIQGADGKSLEDVQLNIFTTETILSGDTEEVYSKSLSEFRTLKLVLAGYNDTEITARSKDYTITKIGNDVKHNCYNIIGNNLKFSTNIYVDANTLKVDVTNTNLYPITMDSVSMIIGN